VLPPRISAMIPPLREMFGAMKLRDRIPQIELAAGDAVTVLVLRHLEPIPDEDAVLLRAFADQYGIQWWLQPKGPETAHAWYPMEAPALDYHLPEFGIALRFGPTEFTQVNAGVNRVLVKRAVDLLDLQAGERVGDLFCGIGNFTLAIASRGARSSRPFNCAFACARRTSEGAPSIPTARAPRPIPIAVGPVSRRAVCAQIQQRRGWRC